MFDEAGYITPQQVNATFEQGQASVKVISADTNAFVPIFLTYLRRVGKERTFTWKLSVQTKERQGGE